MPTMRLSIRARMILAMNLLVAGVGAVVGYAGIALARREIEQRLVHESAANAAALIGRYRWPLDSDDLMTRVAQILGAETASTSLQTTSVLSSSLPPAGRAELTKQLSATPQVPGRVTVGGQWYRVGTGQVRRASVEPLETRRRRFYLLVPEQRVLAAQREVAWQIGLCTLAAVLLATAIGFWMSTTIARPIRRLADRMDRLAPDEAPTSASGGGASPGPAPRVSGAPAPTGPSELARLTRSFEELMSRLAAARAQLERSARLATLGKLAGSVAHELRNPLSGIKMNARILADAPRGGEGPDRSIELIVREIDRMDLYLQELLSLASASGQAGTRAAAPPARPTRLEELADSVANLLAGRCEHAGVAIERQYAADCPPALADGERIRQLLLNLMLNALDAMPHGGRLTLTAGPEGENVRLEVTDTGTGVRAPDGRDIFEPFVTSKPQGTGLGLYLCRQAAETYGGRVGYTTSEAGSTFWVELPATP